MFCSYFLKNPPKPRFQITLLLLHSNSPIKHNCYSTQNHQFSYALSFSVSFAFCIWIHPALCTYSVYALFLFSLNKLDDVCDCHCECACVRRRWSSSSFNIFPIRSIPWSSIKITEEVILVGGAKKMFMVLATVVKNQNAVPTGIINHVRNYPLGCTIPCTQSILLFSFLHGDGQISATTNNFTNANFAKIIKMYTFIGVPVVTSTFTSHALL